MKKLVLAALVAGSIVHGIPAAQANCVEPGPPPEPHPSHCAGYEGGCSYAAVSDPTPDGTLGGQGVYTGEVDWQVLLYDAVNPANNPVSATVSCELQVNGVVQDSTVPTAVTLAGAGADVVTYTKADDSDVVELCTVVTGWSNGLPDVRDCGPATTIQIPPQEIIDLLVAIEEIADTVICPALVALAPGVPGVVDIKVGEGDTSLLGDPFWDCPPYGNFFPDEG